MWSGGARRWSVLKRRTDWFKVRDVRGREGWVHREQLAMTLVPDVGPIDARPPGTDRSGRYRREAGVMAGAFEDDHVLTAYGSYAFNPHLAVELRISQVFSYDYDAQLLALGLTHSFAPDWRVQPFLSIGTGLIRVRPEQPPGPTDDRPAAPTSARASGCRCRRGSTSARNSPNTSCSRSVTTTRKSRNGNSASPSPSDPAGRARRLRRHAWLHPRRRNRQRVPQSRRRQSRRRSSGGKSVSPTSTRRTGRSVPT